MTWSNLGASFIQYDVFDIPEWPTVRTSMGSDPLRRTSSVSGISGLRCSKSLDNASDLDSGKHTVSAPPELRLRSCFFLLAAAEETPPMKKN